MLTLGVLAGCTGSKSFSNKAAKLEKAGLTEEASDFYYMALQRNPQNVDAKIGLKNTGSQILESKLNAFYKAHSLQADKDAVYLYRDAISFQDKCSPFVNLAVPPYYEEYYTESLDRYLGTRYEEAEDLMYQEKYEDADKIFKEILTLKPDYEDAQDKAAITTVEPWYRKGVESFEAGKYRTSYDWMQRVLKKKGTYKDAVDYRDDALRKATLTIAVMPFEGNVKGESSIKNKAYASLLEGLLQSQSPFIKVIDRQNTGQLMKEQRLNMEIGVSSDQAIQTGELLGANVLVIGKVLSYNFTGGRISPKRQQGYESFRVKKVNPETKKTSYVTRYRKTYYTEYSGQSEVTCTFQFQMVSAETGEILASDVIQTTERDYVNYAQYKGNYKNLYAGSYRSFSAPFQAGDKVFTSYRDKQALDQKFTSSKRSLRSENQLNVEISQDIAKKVVYRIEQYNPDS